MCDYTAAVLTISDKGAAGLREDTSGPALRQMLEGEGWNVLHTAILPDDMEKIRAELLRCCDERKVWLVVTTGGTGFSKRDVTPEATMAVVERPTPGIPEATLIVNCPGSEKAARECLWAVLPALKHGVEILRGVAGECGAHRQR